MGDHIGELDYSSYTYMLVYIYSVVRNGGPFDCIL